MNRSDPKIESMIMRIILIIDMTKTLTLRFINNLITSKYIIVHLMTNIDKVTDIK